MLRITKQVKEALKKVYGVDRIIKFSDSQLESAERFNVSEELKKAKEQIIENESSGARDCLLSSSIGDKPVSGRDRRSLPKPREL